jgi:phosphoribosylformylglycinamidine synthase I
MSTDTRKKKVSASRKAPKRTARRAPPSKAPCILVLRAPGTNCDRETAYAFESAGAVTEAMHVNALLEKPKTLERVQGLVIPGGFSYGDDLGAGTVLGTILRTRLRDPIRKMVDKGGIVLGICNGFQVLVKTGLLPGAFEGDDAPEGTPADGRRVALAHNIQNRYEDRWITLRADADNVFFRRGDIVHCPVAHAEGRFLVRDDAELSRLIDGGQAALRYVRPDGGAAAGHPFNPNGATDDIAGVTDASGRILGLMPHPERNQFPWQDPRFHAGTAPRTPEGMLPFTNAVRHLRKTFC